jgi:hypothetical protein
MALVVVASTEASKPIATCSEFRAQHSAHVGATSTRTVPTTSWRVLAARITGAIGYFTDCGYTDVQVLDVDSPMERFPVSAFTNVHHHAVRHCPINSIALNLRISLLHILTIKTRCRRQRPSGSSSAAAVSPACQQRLPSERPTERLQFSNDQHWRLRSVRPSRCNRMLPGSCRVCGKLIAWPKLEAWLIMDFGSLTLTARWLIRYLCWTKWSMVASA